MSDWPAAHSMDTEWFAVDACGHVAHFDSGEAGPSPKSLYENSTDAVLQRMAGMLSRTTAIQTFKSRFEPVAPYGNRHWYTDNGCDHPLLMFLCTPERVQSVIAREGAFRVASEGPPAYLFPRLSAESSRDIHQSDSCAGCTWVPNEAPVDPVTLGLYTYGHLGDAGMSMPYGMETRPVRPIRAYELPLDVRVEISKIVLDTICFEAMRVIQPVEFVPCVTYGPCYLASDGRTIRCTPGREEDYRTWYDNRGDWLCRYHVEPPKDFPAAHSMDTEWFAVDACGHVAHFDSGEAGAVPSDAHVDPDLLGQLKPDVPASSTIINVEACLGRMDPASLGSKGARRHWGTPTLPHPTVFFFDDPSPMAAELRKGSARLLATDHGCGVLLTRPSPQTVTEVHKAGLCRGCTFHVEPERWPSAVGLFGYEHLCDNWAAGPYGRLDTPSRPVLVGSLPNALQAKLRRYELPGLCFGNLPRFQPVEQGTSVVHDAWWVDSRFSVMRAVDGREKEFLAALDELRDQATELGLELIDSRSTGPGAQRVE